MKKVPESQFIGTWKYESESIYNGIIFEIRKNAKGELTGTVLQKNDDKLVNEYMDSNFVLISGISRNSNFEFVVTENKPAKELFGLYGLETSKNFNAQFITKNLIGLSTGKVDPEAVDTKWIRIQKRI